MVASDGSQMFGFSSREFMPAIRTVHDEVEVIGFGWIEHSVYRFQARRVDWSGRQAGRDIGIVGRFAPPVYWIIDVIVPLARELGRINESRVAIEFHIALEP